MPFNLFQPTPVLVRKKTYYTKSWESNTVDAFEILVDGFIVYRAPSGGQQWFSLSVLDFQWKKQVKDQEAEWFTSQSDEKCSQHIPAPSANLDHLASASPPPSVTHLDNEDITVIEF